MRVARGDRFEDRLMQGELGLAVVLLEGQRQGSFGAGEIALSIRPAPHHDESFRWDDLAIDALHPMIVAVGTAHVDPVGAAGAQLVAKDGAGEASRTEPSRHVLGLGPGFEDEAAWRVEDARDNEYAIGRLGGEIIFCGHVSSPSVAVRAFAGRVDSPRSDRSSLPRNGDSARASPRRP